MEIKVIMYVSHATYRCWPCYSFDSWSILWSITWLLTLIICLCSINYRFLIDHWSISLRPIRFGRWIKVLIQLLSADRWMNFGSITFGCSMNDLAHEWLSTRTWIIVNFNGWWMKAWSLGDLNVAWYRFYQWQTFIYYLVLTILSFPFVTIHNSYVYEERNKVRHIFGFIMSFHIFAVVREISNKSY